MAPTIRLKAPNGEIKDVDPSVYDVAGLLKAGATRVPVTRIMVAAHTRSAPLRVPQQPGAEAAPENLAPAPAPPAPTENPIVSALPAVGGMAGGLMGAAGGTVAGLGVGGVPGGLAGAGVGGAGGEAIRQLIDRATGVQSPQTPQDAATKIGEAGAIQTAAQGAGAALGAAAGAVGKGAMALALRSAAPEVVQTAIREGINATRGGIAKLGEKLGEAAGATRSVLYRMGKTGAFINRGALAQQVFADVENQIGKQGITDPSWRKLRDLNNAFVTDSQNPVRLSVERAHEIKQGADALTSPLRAKLEAGAHMTPLDPVEQLWQKSLGDRLRELLNNGPHGVEYQAANARTSNLMALKAVLNPASVDELGVGARVLKAATSPTARFTTGAAAGALTPSGVPGNRAEHALAGGALSTLLGSPAFLSMLARALSSPAVAATLQQTPRTIAAFP